MIIACGYESQKYIPFKVQELQSTFAIASEPFEQKDFWYRNALIWETANPLLIPADNKRQQNISRAEKTFRLPTQIKEIVLIPQKTKSLEQSFSKLFPEIEFKTDFKWAGTFASTKDGLPYIGPIRQRPHTYFALGFGGNGITFSAIAAV